MIKTQRYFIIWDETPSEGDGMVSLSAKVNSKEDRNDLIRTLRRNKKVKVIAWRPIYKNGKIEWHDGRRRLY